MTMSVLKITQRLIRNPKLFIMTILILSLLLIFLYFILLSRSSPLHVHRLDTTYKHSVTGSVPDVVQRTLSEDPAEDPAEDRYSVYPDRLPPVRHEDLFTEFDDVVLGGLYGNNEYVIDYRFDGGQTVFDELSIANATYSSLRLLDRNRIHRVNDVIRVSIEIHNGKNKRILRGGDRIRVFIKDTSRGACANGYVIDHRNGTYTGVVRALWSGNWDIVAAIALPREAVRTLYRIHREGHIVRRLYAIFQRRFRYEMTLCSYSPFVPGYKEVCNLTTRHDGLPWYCGHPEVMRCAEWTRIGASQPPWPLSTEERKLFDVNNSHQNIRQSADVAVANRKALIHGDMHELIACNGLPASATWKQAPPVGYFVNWRWSSTLCVNTLPNTVRSWDECMSGRTVWLHGDSTLRQWFSFIKLRQNIELVTEKWRYETWPLPSTLFSKGHNYAVFWATHELPFTNSGEFVQIEAHKATHAYIDELPAGSRDVVVVHFYLHFTAYPPTLLRTHVRRTVRAVKSLLERAPDVKVFVKGSHAFYSSARGIIDDYWGTVHDQIFKKEFEEVQDKVYFLDFWDMTVASENTGVHPNSTLVEQMIHTMLGYTCP